METAREAKAQRKKSLIFNELMNCIFKLSTLVPKIAKETVTLKHL